jgi:type II secretory pathway pseudopilin PulG
MGRLANREGFTLIQVLLVLALSALLATVTVPVFTFFDRLSARAELDRLYELCMLLQQRAQLENKEYKLKLDLEKHMYVVYQQDQEQQDQQHALAKSVRFGIVPGVKGPPAQPSKILIKPVSFPQNTITFYPTGVIHPGSLYLVDRSTASLYALTAAVSSFSYIRRYSYTPTGWKAL